MKGYVITKIRGIKNSDTKLHVFENIQMAAQYAIDCETQKGARQALCAGGLSSDGSVYGDNNTYDSGWRPDLGDSLNILKSWACI